MVSCLCNWKVRIEFRAARTWDATYSVYIVTLPTTESVSLTVFYMRQNIDKAYIVCRFSRFQYLLYRLESFTSPNSLF